MISSIATPTSLAFALGKRNTSAAEKALGTIGSVASAVGYFDTLSSAVGRGPASTPFMAIGVAGAAWGAYNSARGLTARVTGQEINDALKSQNNGQDLSADDANRLATDITHRLHMSSAVSLASHLALGAAVITGNMPLALGALAIGVGSFGYAGYSALQDAKEIVQVLAKSQPPGKQTP